MAKAIVNNKKWREKDGRLIHDGDCHFWGKQVCTCGLIHHLCPQCPEGDWYRKEWGMHERQLDRIPTPLPYVEPTKEELEERQKLLDEVFPDNNIDLVNR